MAAKATNPSPPQVQSRNDMRRGMLSATPNDRPTRAASGVRIVNSHGPPAFDPVIWFGDAVVGIMSKPEIVPHELAKERKPKDHERGRQEPGHSA